MTDIEVALRLLLAMLAGGLLGLERTRRLRPAGLRTYMLISVGACMVMLAGLYLHFDYGADPARMAAQVVSGIGFIGAGTIMVTRTDRIKGLTTAAGLWAAACLGLIIGTGRYFAALVGFALVAFILWFADDMEKKYSAHMPDTQVHMIVARMECVRGITAFAQSRDIRISELSVSPSATGEGAGVNFIMHLPPQTPHHAVIAELCRLDGVYLAEELPN